MEHLNTEALARLVDEAPRPEEALHLAECQACAHELGILRDQVRLLGALPEIRPPLGDWEVLEARLRSEGLIEAPGLLAGLTLAQTPPWMRAAAGVALFLGGAVVGGGAMSRSGAPASTLGEQPALSASASPVDDAASAVRVAEQGYVNAMTRYRELMSQSGAEDASVTGDARSRYAALEYLVAASQAAVRQAPADPFLNGLLASTLAEREVTRRTMSDRKDNWF